MPIIEDKEKEARWSDEPEAEPNKDPLLLIVDDPEPRVYKIRDTKSSSRTKWLLFLVLLFVALVVLLPALLLTAGRKEDTEPDPAITTLELFDFALPKFSVDAIEADPSSPQAKAYEWVKNDPSLGLYSHDRLLQRFALAGMSSCLCFRISGRSHLFSLPLSLPQCSYWSTRGDEWNETVPDTHMTTTEWISYATPECDWIKGKDDSEDASDANKDDTEQGQGVSFIKKMCGGTSHTDDPATTTKRARHRRMMRMMRRPMRMRAMMSRKSRKSRGSYSYSDSSSYDSYSYSKSYSRSGKGGKGMYWWRERDLEEGQEDEDEDWEQPKVVSHDGKADWDTVTHLHIPESNLVGTLPPEISLLSHVESIDLGHNSLYGRIPSEIFGEMGLLTSLTLQDNFLSGGLPTEVGLWSGLWPYSRAGPKVLNLAHNELNETLPTQLAALQSLQSLDLADNHFTGQLMFNGIGSLSNLHTLVRVFVCI